MNRISITIILLWFSSTVLGQESENLKWFKDFEKAKTEAATTGKPILISFAGSDWCKPCILLTREVFNTPGFSEYADDNLILLLADFPRYKKNRLSDEQTAQNEKLASKYNENGEFPLVVLVDAEGKKLATTGYLKGGADKFITHLNTLLAGRK